MRPEHSDMRLYVEITGLNRGFLELITKPGPLREAPVLGLDAATVDQLRQLSPEELEFIAGTPGLLACFSHIPSVSRLRVAEKSVSRISAQTGWRESARLYVTGLLTYLWQMEQQDWPCCALCAGSTGQSSMLSVELDFTRIRSSADLAVDQLRARFTEHPSFWTDLIRSARSGDAEFRSLSRLTIIPLVLAEECSAR
jgi:hypothetical protein